MERKSNVLLWFFVITFISLSSGCISCKYYFSYQPEPVDWSLQGEATAWKDIKPSEKERMASSAWLGAGVILVVLSPFWGLVGAKIAVQYEKIALKRQQRNERDVFSKE
jgi:hypothetical protein